MESTPSPPEKQNLPRRRPHCAPRASAERGHAWHELVPALAAGTPCRPGCCHSTPDSGRSPGGYCPHLLYHSPWLCHPVLSTFQAPTAAADKDTGQSVPMVRFPQAESGSPHNGIIKDLSVNPRSRASSRAWPPDNPQAEPNPGNHTHTQPTAQGHRGSLTEACNAGSSWPARDSGTQALAAIPTCSATCTRLTAVDLAQGGLLTPVSLTQEAQELPARPAAEQGGRFPGQLGSCSHWAPGGFTTMQTVRTEVL